MRYQNPDKFQFKFSAIETVLPPDVVVGVRESPISSKMTAMLKPSAKYNRRLAIILEGFCAGRSSTEIIWFFGYPRSTVYDVVAKYTALKQYNEGFSMPIKSHSKECNVVP